MFQKYLLIFLSQFWVIYLFAQQADNTKGPKILPPSPDASSLGKYGEIPVSKYTGIPQISIPIYTVSQNDIQVPISLSYHAGGIKVEENASWTGLGWSLNAGGVITRSVVGLPDEQTGSGYLNQPYNIENISSLSESTQQDIVNSVNNRTLDLEPDIYSFNFLGKSGRFIIDKSTRQGIPIPKQNIKIYMPGAIGNTNWEIIDETGFTYIFGTGESIIAESYDGMNRSASSFQNYASAWYLTNIISPTGNQLALNYQSYQTEYNTRLGASKYIFLGGGFDGQYCTMFPYDNEMYTTSTIMGKRIESIEFANGKIKFIKSTSTRLDMLNDYSLQSIEVYDGNNVLIKKFNLTYSYFESNTGLLVNSSGNGYNEYAKKRLRLDQIQDVTVTGSIPPYTFEYIPGELASVFSNDQDHWGYYNGKLNNSLIPLDQLVGWGSGSVNRSVDFNFAQIGTLKKIIYPTGGSTEFEYESNYASVTESEYNTYFYPYGPTSSQYLQTYSARVDDNAHTATFYVDPKTVHTDANNNFFYQVYLADPVNCSGGDRDCIGALEVTIDCLDCGSPGVVGSSNSLTSGDFVNGVSSGYIWLVPGRTYLLQKSGPGPAIQGVIAIVTGIKEIIPTGSDNRVNIEVGGLRVKKITDNASSNSNLITTHYLYTADLNDFPGNTNYAESAGRLVTYPMYDQLNTYIQKHEAQPTTFVYNCFYKVMSSYSHMPLAGTGGSSVGYSNVQVFKESGSDKQRSLSRFISPAEYPDDVSYDYPCMITRSWETMRGSLLSQKEYSYLNNQYVLIKSEENTYEIPSPYTSYNPGVRIGITAYIDPTLGNNEFIFKNYRLPAEWKYLKSTINTTYDQSGNNPLVQSTIYNYDNPVHLQLTSKEQTINAGKKIVTQMVYPQDYITGNTIVDALVSKNIVGEPLETVNYQEDNLGNKTILSGSAVIYKGGGNGLKDEILSIETNTPIGLSTFKFSNKTIGVLPNVSGNSTTFNLDSRYASKLKFNNYDAKGNIIQYNLTGNIIKSYIWGYNKTYPIAEAINAKSNEIYFSDFEKNGWDGAAPITGTLDAYDNTKAHSGRYSGRIDNVGPGEKTVHADTWLTISLTQPTKFKYSGWVYSTGPSAEIFLFMKTATEQNYFTYVSSVVSYETNKWVYVEGEYTVPANITKLNIRIDNNSAGTVWFDDIRLSPSNAQMTTYTYDPLIGMTSQSDANNRVMYYEYDGLGRLSLARDKDKNILKKFCYNYKGQQENCTISTTPLWQSTGNYRCVVDVGGNNTGYQEREEKDNNFNSATYNQLRWVDNGYNTSACPLPCDYYSCGAQGEGYACINGQCEWGYRVNTGSYYDYSSGRYECIYHYEYSDGSWSQDYSEWSDFPCPY